MELILTIKLQLLWFVTPFECFYEAHCKDAQVTDKENMGKPYCVEIVKKAFKESGGDFENPTKESILKAMDNLAEFSRSFRDPKKIEENYAKIMILVNKLK